jgi:hypothetical protein
MIRRSLSGIAALMTIGACSSSSSVRPTPPCAAGETKDCTSVTGCRGVQTCNAQGTAFMDCVCIDGGSGGQGGSASGTGGVAGTGGTSGAGGTGGSSAAGGTGGSSAAGGTSSDGGLDSGGGSGGGSNDAGACAYQQTSTIAGPTCPFAVGGYCATGEACCTESGGNPQCLARTTQCIAGSERWECDARVDCGSQNLVCCLQGFNLNTAVCPVQTGSGTGSTYCRDVTQCSTVNGFQLCEQNGDCPSGLRCAEVEVIRLDEANARLYGVCIP